MSPTGQRTVHEYPLAGGVAVSFQRYPYPDRGWVAAVPRSRGALPLLVRSPRLLCVPSPPGEALWVGFVGSGGSSATVRATAVCAGPGPGDPAVRVELVAGDRPASAPVLVAGIPRGDGTWWALARRPRAEAAPACEAVELGPAPEPVRVELIGAEEFGVLAGAEVPPPGDAYGGWRLP